MPQREPRLLVLPGLNDSGPDHWQTWLERRWPGAVRVVQRHWGVADLQRWAARVGSTLERAGPGPFVAVAHSFGALALVQHLVQVPDSPVRAALLVAPADPGRFGLGETLPQGTLPRPCTLVASRNDPWLPPVVAARWASRWGAPLVQLGEAGHVNVASGHTTFPLAEHWLRGAIERCREPAAREGAPVAAAA